LSRRNAESKSLGFPFPTPNNGATGEGKTPRNWKTVRVSSGQGLLKNRDWPSPATQKSHLRARKKETWWCREKANGKWRKPSAKLGKFTEVSQRKRGIGVPEGNSKKKQEDEATVSKGTSFPKAGGGATLNKAEKGEKNER